MGSSHGEPGVKDDKRGVSNGWPCKELDSVPEIWRVG